MKKTALTSSTTQTVAVAGTATGAVLTVPILLQQTFPNVELFSNPGFIMATNFIMTTVCLPILSRLIAKLRGK